MVFELTPEGEVQQPVLFNAAALHSTVPPTVELKGSNLAVAHAAGEPGTVQTLGVLLPADAIVSNMTVNGDAVKFNQSGSYVEAKVQFKGTALRAG